VLKSTLATKPITPFARTAARVSLVATAGFVLCLALLHIIKPELDPSWHFISEYEIGDYGWVMRLAFFCLSLSCAGLGLAIAGQARTVGGYVGLASLLLAAVGMAMAGVFVTEPITPSRVAQTTHGRLHELGAMLDGVPVAAILINWSLARNQAWRSARPLLFWTACVPLSGLLVFIRSLALMLPPPGTSLGPGVLVGWPNRIMILAHCAWLMPVAWQTIKVSNKPGRG
jgi:hypothetical protein